MEFASLTQEALDRPWNTALAGLILVTVVAYLSSDHFKLRHIPVAGGPSWPLLSYIGSRRFSGHAQEMFQEGYQRYCGRLFKVAYLDRWLVVVTGRKLLHELASLPDEVMSFNAAANDFVEAEYIFGPGIAHDSRIAELVRRDLTRNLTTLFPDVNEEVEAAYKAYIPLTPDWIPIPAHQVTMMVVSRASNRIFVGLPLCRNEEFLKRCGIMYTVDAAKARKKISSFPTFLKPIAGRLLSPLAEPTAHAFRLLMPEIERRQQLLNEHGVDYPGKTNDVLSWMMDVGFNNSGAVPYTPKELVERILFYNFAAIHTSSNTFSHALYTLATNPENIAPLREEMDAIINAEGLTKTSLLKMHKVDSFLRESTRANCMLGMTVQRYALQPHTFSDGTYIPAGTYLAAPPVAVHHDGNIYEHPEDLQPLRFEAKKEDDATRRHFTSTDIDFLPFGHGKHACPGRFFAGAELKTMLVHLLLNYDIRTEQEGVRPPNMHFGQTTMPNPTAKILFRKRRG